MSLLARGILPEVQYSFAGLDGPEIAWRVRRVHLAEGISELYQLVVELITTDIHVDVPALLGTACQLTLARELNAREVFGIVRRAETTGIDPDHLGVRLEIAPALALLSQVSNTRFWQAMNAAQILREVLTDPLQALGRKLRLDLDESAYPEREYCVQCRETDHEFACRLMHEEGISFYFEHLAGESAETLVLVAAGSDHPELEFVDGAAVPLVNPGGGFMPTESLHVFRWSSALRSTSVVQRDYDWQNPTDSPYLRESRGQDARGRDREVYEHEDRRLVGDDGERRSRVKLDEYTGPGETGQGQGDVVEFFAGLRFKTVGHPQEILDRSYLLTRVVHSGDIPDSSPFAQAAGAGPRYVNTFECIPEDIPFRHPRQYPRPRAHGPQTAVVVGPEGEEIHTDAHGRIKVLFHWDRLSPRDDPASCWIRVTQKWAGPGWGFMFLPRIGMEVLVEFLDGDPERPIITGCVYNGNNTPPYPLPDNKTKSTIKSDSSTGGGGSNEIRFEDAKGSEEVFIHAQKDMNEVVENDNTRTVKHNQTFSITANQSFSVGGSQSFSVGGAQSFSVTGDRSVTVSTGNESLTVSAGTSTTQIQKDRKVTVNAGNNTLTVSAGAHSATASGLVTLASKEAGVDISGKEAVSVKSSANNLTLEGNKAVSVAASTQTLSLTGHTATTLTSSTAAVTVTASTEAKVQAKTISITAAESITLSVGSSSIKLEASGVTISAAKIASTAVGMHEIAGALVKIN